MQSSAAVKTFYTGSNNLQLQATIPFSADSQRGQSYISKTDVFFFPHAQKLIPLQKPILRAHSALPPCKKCLQLT